MIEVNVAITGDKIAKRDGKYICSRVDPWREARGWLDFHAEQIKFAESIIVVGLGCGYYIYYLENK